MQVQLDTVLLFNFPIIGQYIFTVSIPPLYPWSGTIRGPFRPLRQVVLDKQADALQQQVANKVYETSRAGHGSLQVSGFPDFKPMVAALQATPVENDTPEYQVTVKRHDKLVVLSSLANKFLEHDEFKEERMNLVTEHNSVFNKDGDFLADPDPTRTLETSFLMLTQAHPLKDS